MTRKARPWDRILSAVIAVLLVAGAAVWFASSQPGSSAHAAPAAAGPARPPATGPYARGHSWQIEGPPDLPAPPGAAASDVDQQPDRQVAPAAFDMQGRSVRYDPDSVPDPSEWAVADTGRRFAIPSVRLNVPLGAVSAARGMVSPPGYRSVYLIRGMGVPLERADTGTVYAATHALRSGTAPGNYVIDVRHARSRLPLGTPIVVGGRTYHVTGSQVIPKPQLSAPRDIWRNRPGRLVLITCLQLAPSQPAVQNLVITAQL